MIDSNHFVALRQQVSLFFMMALNLNLRSESYLCHDEGSSRVSLARVLAALFVACTQELVAVDHLGSVVGAEPLLASV
jgi:hypothetical protein